MQRVESRSDFMKSTESIKSEESRRLKIQDNITKHYDLIRLIRVYQINLEFQEEKIHFLEKAACHRTM